MVEAGDGATPGTPWLRVDLRAALGARTLRVTLATAAPVVVVVGPSGGGKTTLLRVLAGVERRAEGTVEVLGERWQGPGRFVPAWERRVGWVPQESLLFPHLSVRANLGYGGDEGLAEVAALLGVEALLDRQPRHLSGGERQRVALGRALLARPRVLLLDEPFAALDRPLRARLGAEVARRCAARGLPVVLVTHDERDLDVFAAERWELVEGELRAG